MRAFQLVFIFLFCILLIENGIGQKLNGHKVIYQNMDSNDKQIHEKDSIVVGISGSAKYFSSNKGTDFHRIASSSTLQSLWENQDFTIELWVQTTKINSGYQVIASNKDWNSGEIKDFTTNQDFGFSRTSGANIGWSIICQPDGSWAWNIGDGKYRLDYRPTSPRQQINDGEWHQIAFSINRLRKEARMYFDGKNVAIYNLGGITYLNSKLPIALAIDAVAKDNTSSFQGAIDEVSIYNHVLSDNEIAEKYKSLVPAAKFPELTETPVEKLNLMTWNIWHGGRRHGKEIGPQQVIDFIKDTDTDIIMMQETYGSGALIADALGYYFYLASTNISVMSKYPILDTRTFYDAFRFGMTTIQLSKNQKINLASLWIHYLPDWRNDVKKTDATPEILITGEGETRHKEIKEIVKSIDSYIAKADDTPLIIGGDFNGPSYKGWVDETKDWHYGLTVEWPVSKVMGKAGFTDSFRTTKPDLNYKSASMSAKQLTYRIDYIYLKGKKIEAKDSDMHFKYKGIWPSDHPAVTTTISLKE
ncbi:MAG: endonuclease/exonuclease/phosphatase family metal-dependent hydrolase [Bacteroidia bacterium]|jgi:endonuclease/exonuclease/phosphatase family metal-dependent hydrolase